MVPGPAGLEEETHRTAEKDVASGSNRLNCIHLYCIHINCSYIGIFVLMYVM